MKKTMLEYIHCKCYLILRSIKITLIRLVIRSFCYKALMCFDPVENSVLRPLDK